MSVECNFKKNETWQTVENEHYDEKFRDMIGDIVNHSQIVCSMKWGYLACDEENCIFFKEKKQ